MQSPFTKLKERVRLLGNHHQKYLRTIELHHQALIEKLETKGLIDQVHLWKSAPNLAEEMDIIVEVGETLEQKLAFLGCYYAMQFLHTNLRSIDVLMLNLTAKVDRLTVYKNFMRGIGNEFRVLTAHYMAKLLDLFIPEDQRPEFALLGVGTRADQDDIDIGIVDDGSPKREEFNKAIGRLQNEMLKRASTLHTHLSQHVGAPGYSASIAEYRQLLDQEIHDFVIISEMLGAALILGSRRLFGEFKRKVTQRYYYHHGKENKYHEGYLRGILGEVRALLIRQIKGDSINPKDDGLRMLKSIIYVGKTIYRINKVNAWDILDELKKWLPERGKELRLLEESLTFLEIVRFLYQLFIVQEEELHLGDQRLSENWEIIARTLGYQDVGVIKAWDAMLIHYYEYVQQAKEAIGVLLYDLTGHLKSISFFTPMLREAKLKAVDRNLAEDFLRTSRFFRGTRFWDDILEALEEDDGKVLTRFVSDFKRLNPSRRKALIKLYAQCGKYSFCTLGSLLVILAKNARKLQCQDLFEELNTAFLKVATGSRDRILKLAKVFNYYPRLINNYLMSMTEEEQKVFMKLLEGDTWDTDIIALREKLKNLCKLYFGNSRYFRRYFLRVINKYPEYIEYVDDTDKLKQIAQGILGVVEYLPSFSDKKEKLGDYYDLEFFRLGLEILQGVPGYQINAEFTEAFDRYLGGLFDVCKQEVEEQLGGKLATRDLLAIFTAGGHAREQAFDDDCDLIVLLNSSDEQMRTRCTRIITRMNAELIKRGVLPHYRLATYFGHYVTLMHELELLFSQDREDSFIEKSQILGARMIVGSTKFEKEFQERIIKPYIFDQRQQYVADMINEIRSRHRDNHRFQNNIKETIGGLRDIEMILLVCKAQFGLTDPVNRKLMDTLSKMNGRCSERMQILAEAFDFLKQIRDIYRMTVAAGDTIYSEYLDRTARIMGFVDNPNQTATDKLLTAYHAWTGRVNEVVTEMMEELLKVR